MTSLTVAPELTLRLIVAVTAVWVVASAAALLLRRASAALRHQVWSLSTVAVLLLPALHVTLPEWRVGRIELPQVAALSATPAPVREVPAPVPPPEPSFQVTQAQPSAAADPTATPPFAEEPARPIHWMFWMWLLPALCLAVRHIASL